MNTLTLSWESGAALIVDDITISTPSDLRAADAHTRVRNRSEQEKTQLLAFLQQLDRRSAPEDDETVILGSNEEQNSNEDDDSGNENNDNAGDDSSGDAGSEDDEQGNDNDNAGNDSDSGSGSLDTYILFALFMIFLGRRRYRHGK